MSSLGGGTLGGGSGGALAPPPFIAPAPPIVLEEWPASLPQYVLMDDYREPEPDILYAFQPDHGPAKQRPMFTRAILPFTMSVELDLDQVVTFDAFYTVTLRHGTIPFTWVHPRSGVQTNFRFVGGQPQKVRLQGGRNYRVSMILEVMPL